MQFYTTQRQSLRIVVFMYRLTRWYTPFSSQFPTSATLGLDSWLSPADWWSCRCGVRCLSEILIFGVLCIIISLPLFVYVFLLLLTSDGGGGGTLPPKFQQLPHCFLVRHTHIVSSSTSAPWKSSKNSKVVLIWLARILCFYAFFCYSCQRVIICIFFKLPTPNDFLVRNRMSSGRSQKTTKLVHLPLK